METAVPQGSHPPPLATVDCPRWSEHIRSSETFPRPSGALPVGILEGEGIGPEVTAVALEVLSAVEAGGGRAFDLRIVSSLATEAVVAECRELFAAGGALLAGPRGGRFVYDLRRELGLFCKLSPVVPFEELAAASRLRPEALRNVDLLVVRENLLGGYQGSSSETLHPTAGRRVEHRFTYTEEAVRAVLAPAARISAARRGKLAVVVKEGGLPALSSLWRECASEIASVEGVELAVLDIDFAAYRLVQHAAELDVLVAPNLFGDVLSDLGGLLMGSRALTYGASFGSGPGAVYQTNHGAAYDLAGSGRANPGGQILALAMLLRESFGLAREAAAVEEALRRVWRAGWRTDDLAGEGGKRVGTGEMGRLVATAVGEALQDGHPA